MTRLRKFACSFVSAGVAATLMSAADAALILEQPETDFSSGTAFAGQAFVPSDAVEMTTSISPVPFPDTVELTEFTLFRGNPDDPGDVYLNIYSTLDSGALSGFVGSSTNVIDWNTISPGEAAVFTFDNLTLDSDTKYFAALSTTNTTGSIVSTRLRGQGGNPYLNGGAVLNNGGTITEAANNDTKFEAVFIPEPGSLTLGLLGVGLMAFRRRTAAS